MNFSDKTVYDLTGVKSKLESEGEKTRKCSLATKKMIPTQNTH
jgi:hypothetical protein